MKPPRGAQALAPRALAITPPRGRPSALFVELWRKAGLLTPEFALLVRRPGASAKAASDLRGELGPLLSAAREAGLRLWLACELDDAAALRHHEALARERGFCGLYLRGAPPAPVRAALEARAPDGLPSAGGAHVYSSVASLSAPHRFWTFAPVFSPKTPDPERPKRAQGLPSLREAVARASAPVLALGGITPERVGATARAGASGVAGIAAFFPAEDPGTELARLARAIEAEFPART